MYAFISYHSGDKVVAGEVRDILEGIGVKTFLAHEDIDVSYEWRGVILEEIAKADVFVAILSKAFCASHYCLQESGIAASRTDMAFIPLSIDGTTPPGFLNHVQAKKIAPGDVSTDTVVAGVAKKDRSFVIRMLTQKLAKAGSYATAETRIKALEPFLAKATKKEKTALLNEAAKNGQVAHAWGCRPILEPLFDECHDELDLEAQNYLAAALKD